ncbi:hypothetical protein PanWU01x14_030790, partial [Parasponia andersonii]
LDDWVLCRMYKNKGFGKRIKSREDKGITQNGSNRVQTFPPKKKMRNKKKKNNNKSTPSIDHNQERKEGGISDSNINNNNNSNGTNLPSSSSKQQAIDQRNMVSENFYTIISSGNENVVAPT